MNRMNEKRKRKKKRELIQHNVTYKKLLKKREKENVVDSYKEFRYIYIYILNVINVEIIKLMKIYTVFWDR